MINNKTVYFGYGSVLVSSGLLGLILTDIKPPQEVGSIPQKDSIELGAKIAISDCETLFCLEKELETIDPDKDSEINVDQYTFVFKAGCQKSLDVLRRGVSHALECVLPLMAC